MDRPNILFLLTDDQRADTLSCMGHPAIRTPHLDALAAGGVPFRRAFVTDPTCKPSRTTYFTGRYERVHRVGFSSRHTMTEAQWSQTYPARSVTARRSNRSAAAAMSSRGRRSRGAFEKDAEETVGEAFSGIFLVSGRSQQKGTGRAHGMTSRRVGCFRGCLLVMGTGFFARLAQDEEPAVRRAAVSLFCFNPTDHEATVVHLAQAAGDEVSDVRKHALEAVPGILDRIRDDADGTPWYGETAACRALTEIGGREALSSLLSLLNRPADPWVDAPEIRLRCVTALGSMAPKSKSRSSIADRLARVVKEDTSEQVRARAAETVERLNR